MTNFIDSEFTYTVLRNGVKVDVEAFVADHDNGIASPDVWDVIYSVHDTCKANGDTLAALTIGDRYYFLLKFFKDQDNKEPAVAGS